MSARALCIYVVHGRSKNRFLIFLETKCVVVVVVASSLFSSNYIVLKKVIIYLSLFFSFRQTPPASFFQKPFLAEKIKKETTITQILHPSHAIEVDLCKKKLNWTGW